jgi:hypothetical protein
MTETNSKIGFRQFPPAIKFVVVWICLLSLGYLWATLDGFISTRSIRVFPLIFAFAYLYLAFGLTDKSNVSRVLSSILIGVGTMVRFALLIWLFVVDKGGGYIEYNLVRYPISLTRGAIFLVLNIFFNMGILYNQWC